MRRSPDGKTRQHVAVWVTGSDTARYLRNADPSDEDSAESATLKTKLNDLLYEFFETVQITWCPVIEERSEIIVRRDTGTPVEWFADKRVLVLGCGALGSWASEIIARAKASLIHLVDHSIVKPGLLTRQNFLLEDIGSNKAEALARRLRSISFGAIIKDFSVEAHKFITEDLDRFNSYDVVLDCTASEIVQMKLERDWSTLGGCNPYVISVIIDGKAQHCLAVIVGPNSRAGIWDAYVKFKYRLCLNGRDQGILSAFYSEQAFEDLLQPEPGCSEPTFYGSTADVAGLVSTALNYSASQTNARNESVGVAFSARSQGGRPAGSLNVVKLESTDELSVGQYKVRISGKVYREARAWVRQNNRIRSPQDETGGLLWGLWDDVVGVIWVFDASGPPPDSLHDPGHFVCGVEGTVEEHVHRVERSRGTCGFIGFWHTHPDMPSQQSSTDIVGMAKLVSRMGQNQQRALMLIFGRTKGRPSVGVYVYESESLLQATELVAVDIGQIELKTAVV